jgi:alpha-L-fucosidase
VITADRDDGYHLTRALKTDSYDDYYKPFDGENQVVLTVKFGEKRKVSHVVIKEHIPMSQRVEAFLIEAKDTDGRYHEVFAGTTIGYKKIARFDAVFTDEIRIKITDSRVCPVLSFIGIY